MTLRRIEILIIIMISDISNILAQINMLIDHGLFHSAEILCAFLLSTGNNSNLDYRLLFEKYGDAIYNKCEYKRALEFYGKAYSYISGSCQSRRVGTSVENESDAGLKFKECLCHSMMKDFPSALRELEVIPQQLRDFKINFELGKLYKNAGLRRHAVGAYKEALNQLPSAVEVICELVNLDADYREVTVLYNSNIHPSKQEWHLDIMQMIYNAAKGYTGKLLVNNFKTSYNNLIHATFFA